jgi:hypothetical protein
MLKSLAAILCLLSFAARADETITLIAGVQDAGTVTLEKGELAKLLYVATPTIVSGNPATVQTTNAFCQLGPGLTWSYPVNLGDVELLRNGHRMHPWRIRTNVMVHAVFNC